MRNDIAPTLLRALLKYDPSTGRLYWRRRPVEMFEKESSAKSWNTRYAGKEAFTAAKDGCRVGSIFSQTYRAHRVIWALEKGSWPADQIDHKVGVTLDNRVSELREATNTENGRNQKKQIGRSSAHKGVCWHKRARKWVAYIKTGGRLIHLGCYTNEEHAAAAYNKAAETFFGDFARLN